MQKINLEALSKKELLRNKNFLLSITLVGVLSLPGFSLFYADSPQEIYLNGQPLGITATPETIEEILSEITQNKSLELGGQNVVLNGNLEFGRRVFSFKGSDRETISTLLAQQNYAVTSTAIQANGNTCVIVKDEATANQVLEQLKRTYIQLNEGEILKDATFLENITLAQVEVTAPEVLTLEEAVERLRSGINTVTEYEVQEGDSLWAIARANDMRVKHIFEMNPQLETENLSLGQILRLENPVPLVNVQTVVEKKSVEEIEFPVEVKESSEKLKGFREVQQAGSPGNREVVYHIVRQNDLTLEETILQETITQKPVTQIVLQGTQVAVASREGSSAQSNKATVASSGSSKGTGSLSWPIRGRITSPFGYRGQEFHTGLDIKGNTGDPIRAADSGKVTGAGTSGGYGKLITISHGNGVVTRYAHCSAIDVKVGDTVSKGQVIGKVGSTGRSTGSHLHLEVLINGNPVSPIKYLN